MSLNFSEMEVSATICTVSEEPTISSNNTSNNTPTSKSSMTQDPTTSKPPAGSNLLHAFSCS